MRVHIPDSQNLSRAMKRVEHHLLMTMPRVHNPAEYHDADMVVLHTIGTEVIQMARECRARGQKYAIIQYCLRTTQRPSTIDWMETWNGAAIVWSYYDLFQLCRADGQHHVNFNFYYAPMGADSHVFNRGTEPYTPRRHSLLTSGYVAGTECAQEGADASLRARRPHIHLGPDLRLGPHVTYKLGIDDIHLARVYRQCEFVAGLRRIEGFELPAAEGLLCGARPIMFDKPHYRDWFGPWAEFIHEGSPKEVTASITSLIKKGARPVTDDEIASAARAFDWTSITSEFWRRVDR